MERDDWLASLRPRLMHTNRALRARLPINDVIAVVEMSASPKSGLVFAGIGLCHDVFSELAYAARGRPQVASAFLTGRAGSLRPPFSAALLRSYDEGDRAAFAETVIDDASAFLSKANSLVTAYDALVGSDRISLRFEPDPGPRAALFAAILAAMLGRPWRKLIAEAQQSAIEGFVLWTKQVEARLGARSGP